jgi:hypothetical protein
MKKLLIILLSALPFTTFAQAEKVRIAVFDPIATFAINDGTDVIVREIEPDMVYELLVVEEERIIWSAEAGLPHVGWTTYLHYEQDGKCYLVEYQPQMYQGVGTYKYRMFSLNNNVETIKKRGLKASFYFTLFLLLICNGYCFFINLVGCFCK